MASSNNASKHNSNQARPGHAQAPEKNM